MLLLVVVGFMMVSGYLCQNVLPCDDTLLNHCQYSFNEALGIPSEADWLQPSLLESALESIYLTQGVGGFIKVCSAWHNFQACLGATQFACLNPLHFLHHHYGNTTFQFVAIVQKIDFMCSSAYTYAANSWSCLSAVFRNKQAALQQCNSEFQQIIHDVPDVDVCDRGNALLSCVSIIFDEYCAESAGWFGCEMTRRQKKPQYPACAWGCHASYIQSQTTQTFAPITTTTPVPQTTYPYSSAAGWQKAGQILAQSIDLSADPCSDFYQFSCGQWMQEHPIPQHHSQIISFSIMQSNIFTQLSNIMQNMSASGLGQYQNVRSIQEANYAWKACMSSNDNMYNGTELFGVVNEYGGWPMIQQSWGGLPIDYSIDFLVGHFSSFFGIATFLPWYVDTDWKVNSRQNLWIDQPSLYYSNIYYTTPAMWSKLRPSLVSFMNSTANYFANLAQATVSQTQLSQDINDILDMEFEIAANSVPSAQRRNYTTQYNIYNFDKLSTNFPSIDWRDYFKGISVGILPSPEILFPFHNMGLNEPTVTNYVNNLWSQAKINPKIKRKLVNYLMWRVVSSQLQFVPQLQGEVLKFKRAIHDVDALPPTSIQCVTFVLGGLQYPVSRLYIDYYNANNPGARTVISTMVDTILKAFTNTMIPNLSWMDQITKIMATYKASQLKENVEYPNWIMDNIQLDAAHPISEIYISPQDDYITVYNKLTKFGSWFQLNMLTHSTDRTNFNGPPAIVNAWYQPELNSITFPAGILNSPFFDTAFPMAVNYGGMGVVMGHELTHGFDDEGVQWNFNGTLIDWMDNFSSTGFETNVAKCIQDEYSGFCYPPSMGLNPNCISGDRTQGENIADNGGIKAAYDAYKQFIAINGAEARLPPPMNQFSMDQIFFMSFAQVWCRNIKPSALQSQLLIDPHSPAQFRVKGTVRNFPAFATAFNCPVNSPMAPTNHCTIW